MIALVTSSAARDHDYDLDLLVNALDAIDKRWRIVNWDDQTVNWSDFSVTVLRSTWDYFSRLGEFLSWCEHTGAKTTLHNPTHIVRWNADKQYLRQLRKAGIAVMDTTFVSDLDDIATEIINRDVIIKPTVSAGSNNTARSRGDAKFAREQIARILATGGVAMVQPYSPTIDKVGEVGLVYLEGQFSHAFSKGALFGVESQVHNGVHVVEKIGPHQQTMKELLLGGAVMKFVGEKFAAAPLYARVDMVTNADGVPEIMEVELIEPSLYLHLGTDSPMRAAQAIANADAEVER